MGMSRHSRHIRLLRSCRQSSVGIASCVSRLEPLTEGYHGTLLIALLGQPVIRQCSMHNFTAADNLLVSGPCLPQVLPYAHYHSWTYLFALPFRLSYSRFLSCSFYPFAILIIALYFPFQGRPDVELWWHFWKRRCSERVSAWNRRNYYCKDTYSDEQTGKHKARKSPTSCKMV